MRKIFTALTLLATLAAGAKTVQVTTSDFSTAYTKAADGDVLEMAAGSYGGNLTFPSGKTITMKAADGATVNFACLFRANDIALTNGGIVLDGVNVSITDNYFINLDHYADIKTITMKNCDIANIGRCFLRTNDEGKTIDEIVFDNCVIHDCGSGGWNFMYPKHAVKKVVTTNSTLYNYANGESFFCQNANVTSTDLTFVFSNNTVYKWAKSNDRALAKTEGKYSANSTYTFNNNIVYKGGADNVKPQMVQTNNGKVVANNNLIVEYGSYTVGNGGTKEINDLTLEGLGISALPFPNPDGGDFTITSTSPLATASTTGGIVGDPRWLKVVKQAVNLTVTASPAEGGTVTPESAVLEAGENATVSAAANYGFRFKEWQDASGAAVSTENPYTFKIEANTELKAVFSTVETYTLTVNTSGDGAKWGVVTLTPEPINGVYEEGTEVAVAVRPNSVTNFLTWEDGSTQSPRVVKMTSDKTVDASFDVVPFIVAWDFVDQSSRNDRPADYAFTTDNTGLLQLYNGDGSTTSWANYVRNFSGGELPCIRRYTDYSAMSNPRAFVVRFNADGYSNIVLHAKTAFDNDCVHKTQKIQISSDNQNWTDLKNFELTDKNKWEVHNISLPEGTAGTVYIRFVGDPTSGFAGSNPSGSEGFYLADLVVYADAASANDHEAPVLLASSPAQNAESALANGSFILTFNERVKAGEGTVTLDGKTLEPKFGSKTVTIPYTGLAYGTPYTLAIGEGAIVDLSGNAFPATEINFTTMTRPQPEARLFDAVVAADGTGDYTTLQAAIDAVPENRIAPWLIFLKNGEYKELIMIPKTKPYIHLIGQDKEKTIISYKINNGSEDYDKIHGNGWEYSTNNPESPSFGKAGVVQIEASNFYAENITFLNSYGVEAQNGPMAQAVHSAGDRQAYNNCKFRSFQDTWYTDVKNVADRHYVNNCWIEGAVDYFYGPGDCYVENTTFWQARATGSVVVAPSHKAGTKYGYVIDRCVLDGPGQNHKLGRPWANEPIAVFLNTTFKANFAAEGWSSWHIAPKLFAEYNSMDADGNPIDLSNRLTVYPVDNQGNVSTRAILTADEAAQYTYENVTSGTDGWNPRAYFEPVAAPTEVYLNPANGLLTWKPSDYAICYVVLDSEDNILGFTKETSYQTPVTRAASDKTFKVKAVNEYGSLGAPAVSDIQTGLENLRASDAEVVSRVYYNALGAKSLTPVRGMNIVVETLSDGTTRTIKNILK